VRGHNVADLDPLGIYAADLDTSEVPELLPHTYALGNAPPLCWVSSRPHLSCLLHAGEFGRMNVALLSLDVRNDFGSSESTVMCIIKTR